MLGSGEERERRKSRWEKRVVLHSLQSRMSRATVSLGGGFSVRGTEELAGSAISKGVWMEGILVRREDLRVATFSGSIVEQPVAGSPQTTLPHVRQ